MDTCHRSHRIVGSCKSLTVLRQNSRYFVTELLCIGILKTIWIVITNCDRSCLIDCFDVALHVLCVLLILAGIGNTEVQLISDILDLSKIEAGTFDIIPERVNAKQLCNDLFQAMQMKTSPQVELRLKDNLPELTFTSDKNRLYQVLLNFVTNALKFTSEGNITIDYQIDGNEVKFSVQDTGMGIEPEKQEAIFTRFVKLNSFIPGTGLGLPICQSIVTQLGGKIGVESEPGRGACFWFTHPIN